MRFRPFFASSIIVLVVIASHRAEASAILFTDSAPAFELAAAPNLSPLRVTDADLIAAGQFVYTYGDILPVFVDVVGLSCCVQTVGDVGVIPRGGEPYGNSYAGVGQFYDADHRRRLRRLGRVHAERHRRQRDEPDLLRLIFDQPTTYLPLPQVALFPRPGSLPRQGLLYRH